MIFLIQEAKDNLSFDEINCLTESVGWGKCFHKSDKIWKHVLAMSSYIAYIKDNDKLIAFGRILEDGMMCMFYDVCVHPDYQGRGIGMQIMNHLIDKIKNKEYISVGLFAWEGNQTAPDFYKKLGFEPVRGMELKNYKHTIEDE